MDCLRELSEHNKYVIISRTPQIIHFETSDEYYYGCHTLANDEGIINIFRAEKQIINKT